jgi:hypothetical protein
MPDEGLSRVKRAELVAHAAELKLLIEDQDAHVKVAMEMGWLVPVMLVRLERLREARRRYVSALEHLLGENIDDYEPGNSR